MCHAVRAVLTQAAEHGATDEPLNEAQFDLAGITRVKMPWFGTPLGYATVPKPGNISGERG